MLRGRWNARRSAPSPAARVDPCRTPRPSPSSRPACPGSSEQTARRSRWSEWPAGRAARSRAARHRRAGAVARLARARKALRRTLAALPGSGWCERAERLISDRIDGALADARRAAPRRPPAQLPALRRARAPAGPGHRRAARRRQPPRRRRPSSRPVSGAASGAPTVGLRRARRTSRRRRGRSRAPSAGSLVAASSSRSLALALALALGRPSSRAAGRPSPHHRRQPRLVLGGVRLDDLGRACASARPRTAPPRRRPRAARGSTVPAAS